MARDYQIFLGPVYLFNRGQGLGSYNKIENYALQLIEFSIKTYYAVLRSLKSTTECYKIRCRSAVKGCQIHFIGVRNGQNEDQEDVCSESARRTLHDRSGGGVSQGQHADNPARDRAGEPKGQENWQRIQNYQAIIRGVLAESAGRRRITGSVSKTKG